MFLSPNLHLLVGGGVQYVGGAASEDSVGSREKRETAG